MQTRKRESKDQTKVKQRIAKLTKQVEDKVMCKVIATVDKRILKIKYLHLLPQTYEEAILMVQDLLPATKLNGIMMGDPCGDWVNIENDLDLESMYRVSELAEQKIIKIQAEFESKQSLVAPTVQ